MVREVVEVVARFGETVLDIAHLGPDDTYRIGTAPGCDLTVPGLACFPLVAGGVVRCPIGLSTRTDKETTELRVGALVVTVARTQLAPAALPAPRVELRTPLFVAASLVAHVGVWLAAERFAALERIEARPRPLLARLIEAPVPPPPPPPKAPPPPQQTAQLPPSAPPPRRLPAPSERAHAAAPRSGRAAELARAREAARDNFGAAIAAVAKSFDDTHVVERVGALTAEGQYDEDAANAQGFGGSRRFDPTQREGWGTVATGAYVTFDIDFKQCPNGNCEVVGPIPALYVRTHLLAHLAELYDCYRAHASAPGMIVLEFTITPDGAVRDARGSGLGDTGACAARVVETIFFRALGGDTRVRWPVLFKS